MMKKIIILSLLVVMLIISGCIGEDLDVPEELRPPKEALVGQASYLDSTIEDFESGIGLDSGGNTITLPEGLNNISTEEFFASILGESLYIYSYAEGKYYFSKTSKYAYLQDSWDDSGRIFHTVNPGRYWINVQDVGSSLMLRYPVAESEEIDIGGFPFEVIDGALLIKKSVTNEELNNQVSNYLKEKGLDKAVTKLATDHILDISITQKIIKEGMLESIADIKGTAIQVFIDDEGRVEFSEMISYKPHKEIYCEDLDSSKSGIPCLKIKTKGETTKINAEAKQIVDGWRSASKKYPDKPVAGRRGTEIVVLTDEELWAYIFSQSLTFLSRTSIFAPVSPAHIFVPASPAHLFRAPKVGPLPVEVLEVKIVGEQQLEGQAQDLIFITGDTVDVDSGWRDRWGTCIDLNPLVGGCTNYYLEPYYDYSFLFGLRIPLRVRAESSEVVKVFEHTTGNLALNIEPFDGDADDYREAQMPNNLVYWGRELLAEFCHRGCSAGLRGDIPGPDPLPISVEAPRINLLGLLPQGFSVRDGNIDPPDVGSTEMMGEQSLGVDILAGQANIGIAGATIEPYVRVDMRGLEKSIKVDTTPGNGCDSIRGNRFFNNNIILPFDLVNENNVIIGLPKYTFDFQFTVGLEPEIRVDVGLWDNSWSVGKLPLYRENIPDFRIGSHPGTYCGYYFGVSG